MNKLLDDFSELVKNKLGFAKLLAFIFLLFTITYINSIDYKSFSEWLLNQNSNILKDFLERLSNTKIQDILLNFIYFYIANKIYQLILKAIIKGQSKQENFIESIKKIANKQKELNDIKISERESIKKLMEKESNSIKENIKNKYEIGSALFSYTFCSFFLYTNIGKIDVAILLLFIATSFYLIHSITTLFISEYSKVIYTDSIIKCIDIEKLYFSKIDDL